jgi:mono/diheme cytochrome c family protein
MKEHSEPEKSKKEVYQEAYDASKEGGESFYPYTLVKDAIMALVVVGGIIALALLVPPTLEPPADPTSTTYNPRPEWYFLFFFQFLKLFPGSMEALAAIIIPLVVLLLLAILPFLDRGLERRWSRRKGMIAIGLAAVILFVGLEVAGATSAPAQPAGEESREVQMGREVYQEINCAYCHTIDGTGGNLGPDLSGVGGQLGTDEIRVYLQNPNRMVPESLHPNLLFTEEEMDALVAYLITLGATIEYSDQAPLLFDQNCASCHMIGGQGGTLGPDLSAVGGHRSVNFLAAFTADPKTVLPGATMPAYKDVLNEAQISDLAAYLASQQGETATAPPANGDKDDDEDEAPTVPHSLENREDCLTCHATGAFKPFPDDHVGRGVENCLGCHQTDE